MKTVAEFTIRYEQLLTPEGVAAGELPPFARDPEEILRMYRLMTLVRIFDAKAVNLQRTRQLGTYASCLGHEAAHVGVGAALRPEDVLAPVYREYGSQLWRGVTMQEILMYWGGDERVMTSPAHGMILRGAYRSPHRPCMRPARQWHSKYAMKSAARSPTSATAGPPKGRFTKR